MSPWHNIILIESNGTILFYAYRDIEGLCLWIQSLSMLLTSFSFVPKHQEGSAKRPFCEKVSFSSGLISFRGAITLLETIVIFSSILAATYARYDHPFDYVHPPSPLSTKCQVVASNRAKITTNTIKCPKVSVIKVSRLWCAQHKILTPGLIVISILLTCITGADEVMCIHRSCTVHSNTVHKKPVKFRVFFTTVSLQYDDMKVFLVCHTDDYKYMGMFTCTQAKEVFRPKSSFCDRRVGSCEFEFVGCVRHPTKCGRMKKICVEETLKTQEGQPFHHNFQ